MLYFNCAVEVRGLGPHFAHALGLESASYTGVGYSPSPRNSFGEKLATAAELLIGDFLRVEVRAVRENRSMKSLATSISTVARQAMLEMSEAFELPGMMLVVAAFGRKGSLAFAISHGEIVEAPSTAASETAVFHDGDWDEVDS